MAYLFYSQEMGLRRKNSEAGMNLEIQFKLRFWQKTNMKGTKKEW